jgi:hypothetical protein
MAKNKAIVLYQTDFNHTYDSRKVIGVFVNTRKYRSETLKIIRNQILSSGERYALCKENIDWNFEFMMKNKQTQGLEDFELVAEEIELNKIV